MLDARSGAARDSVRIPLPAGIAATVTDTPGASFRVRADSAGASKLVVHWEATKSCGRGAVAGLSSCRERRAVRKALAPKIVSGQAEVDLAAPSLKMKTPQAASSEESAAVARAALQELRTPAVAAAGRQLLSADGRHVLVTEPMGAAEPTLYRHRWTVYERESGARLGSVSSLVVRGAVPGRRHGSLPPGPAHGIVQKGRFVESPAALRAVNLQTGAEMWKSAVLETSFEDRSRPEPGVGREAGDASLEEASPAFREPFERAGAQYPTMSIAMWTVPPGAVVARTASLPVPSDESARTALFARVAPAPKLRVLVGGTG